MTIPDGRLEALKWSALLLMTLDHVNTFLLAGRHPWLFAAGRIAMPVFAFVLACNLARPDALKGGIHLRAIRRLALAGLASTPFFIALNMPGRPGNEWHPLNILFLLMAGTGICLLLENGGAARIAAALFLFAGAGAVVEFLWFGLAVFLAAWWYCKKPGALRFAVWLVAAASLYMVNRNFWAVAAIPLIIAVCAMRLDTIRVPRIRHFFYWYYPAHLAVLLGLSRWPASA